MLRIKHTVEQILHKLREADVLIGEGKKVSDLCCKWSIIEPMYYRWRKEYGGLKLDKPNTLRTCSERMPDSNALWRTSPWTSLF